MNSRRAKIVGSIAITGIILSVVMLSLRDGQDSKGQNKTHKSNLVRFAKSPDLPNVYLIENAEDLYYLRPLQDTDWRTAEQATYMKADDIVFGLYLQGRAWAMPWWVIKNHHVANLTLGDQPVLFTFCEVCSGGAAFVPVLNGKRHTFRVVGLYNGTHFISDYQSGTYWLSFVGEAFFGPLKGSRLELLPLHHCTWAQWLALHPESLVADGENEPRGRHGKRWRPGKNTLPEFFRRSLVRPFDLRLRHNELVVGVEINGRSRAYPIPILDNIGPVVNDTLGQREIVILHKPGTLLTTVLSRRLGGKVLVFDIAENGEIIDQESRSSWNYEGEADAGALAGRKLSYVPWTIEEWYTWVANHPETEIYKSEDPARTKTLGRH